MEKPTITLTAAMRECQLVDVYAGLRRIGYHRNGAIVVMVGIGVPYEDACKAADTSHDAPGVPA